MRTCLAILLAALLAACQPADNQATEATAPSAETEPSPGDPLALVLDSMPDEAKARYRYRHPQETLEFFGIEPGMTVVEALPGGGWYTRILANYLGEDGHITGADYALDMYRYFSFASESFMARKEIWTTTFPDSVAEWGGGTGAGASAFHFGSMPSSVAGTADAALVPRALHNLARFQSAGEGDYLDVALADLFAALKPGGVLGVVQHEARPDMPDEWATGGAGYLKKAFVIEAVEAAGFEFVAESPVNENPEDRPTANDVVWRLPPAYNGTRDDPELKAAVDAIGESNRMTLRFLKPR